MQNIPEESLDRVILVWLLIHQGRKGLRLPALVAALSAMLDDGQGAARRAAVGSLERLQAGGFIAPETKLSLSEQGRAAGLAALGLEALPERQRVDFAWAKRLLLARALDQPASAAMAGGDRVEALAASVLARHHGLPASLTRKPLDVWSALAWQALECEPGRPFRGPRVFAAVVLGVGYPPVAAPPTIPATPVVEPTEADLPTFAARVNEAAHGAPTGRWLDKKVFVSHVWRELIQRGHAESGSFERFKHRLVAAHRAGLVRLHRADVISVMPEEDVRASEAEDGDSTFHFIRIDHL